MVSSCCKDNVAALLYPGASSPLCGADSFAGIRRASGGPCLGCSTALAQWPTILHWRHKPPLAQVGAQRIYSSPGRDPYLDHCSAPGWLGLFIGLIPTRPAHYTSVFRLAEITSEKIPRTSALAKAPT